MVPAKRRSRCRSAWSARSFRAASRSAAIALSSVSWKRPRSSAAALRVKVTAAIWSTAYVPSSTPAAIRRARHSVLPEPAPASTSRLTSRRRRMRSRAAWSGTERRSGMAAEPPVGLERGALGSLDLPLRSLGRLRAARPPELAEAAIVGGRRRVHEGAGRQHVEQVAQHRRDLLPAGRRTHLPLLAAPPGGEIVGADGAGVRVRLTEQLDRGQGVEGVLELPATRERRLEAAGQERAPSLVVDDLVAAVGQAIDAVDPATEPKPESIAQIEGHRLALRERLALRVTAERDLESERPPPRALGLE